MMTPARQHITESILLLPHDKLELLLTAYGIASQFIEFSGNIARTPLRNRVNILMTLGIAPTTLAALEQLLADKADSDWREWVRPVIVLREGESSIRVSCRIEDIQRPMHWEVIQESGAKLSDEFIPAHFPVVDHAVFGDRHYIAIEIQLPALAAGYHHLMLNNGEKWVSSFVIVSPVRCHEPQWSIQGRKIWGVSAQLYSLRSLRNWGMGDFSDLKEVVLHSSAQGAHFILLNPLHALDLEYPENCSPYSPVDRRFLNPLYIDPEAEEDFTQNPLALELCNDPQWTQRKAALNATPMVEYAQVFRLKFQAFELMYRFFQERHVRTGSVQAKQFAAYIDGHDSALQIFASFQSAIALEGVPSCREPEFHMYLQWLADRQLSGCQTLAISQGMTLGIVRDLAVGGGSQSCEVQTNPELFCLEARIGAPPDNFNPDGQNWGLPPIRPDMLEKTHFAHFIKLLRANMRSCGALRIDHVMALMRLWWCPADGSNASGAYVQYPVDALFAILRIESQRAQCLIIGEDLGVVPPQIRSHINASAIFSNIVFYFEKYEVLQFKKPAHYAVKALAMIANHDVPTLRAWWESKDLLLRKQLGLIETDARLAREIAHRDREKEAVFAWLDAEHLLPQNWLERNVHRDFDTELCRAILRCCATSSSQLLSVQIDDLALLDMPVNIPGTSQEYPNWQRKIPPTVQELFAAQDIRQMLAGIHEERP